MRNNRLFKIILFVEAADSVLYYYRIIKIIELIERLSYGVEHAYESDCAFFHAVNKVAVLDFCNRTFAHDLIFTFCFVVSDLITIRKLRINDTDTLATLDKRLDNGVGISDDTLNCRSRRVFVGTYNARHFHFDAAVSVDKVPVVFGA